MATRPRFPARTQCLGSWSRGRAVPRPLHCHRHLRLEVSTPQCVAFSFVCWAVVGAVRDQGAFETIRFIPSLNVTAAEIDMVLDLYSKAVKEVFDKQKV